MHSPVHMLVPSCVTDFADSQFVCYQWTRRSCGIFRHTGVSMTLSLRVGTPQEMGCKRIPATKAHSTSKRTAVLGAATLDVFVRVYHFSHHFPSTSPSYNPARLSPPTLQL